MGQKRSEGNTNRKSSKSGTDPKDLEIGLKSIKPVRNQCIGGCIRVAKSNLAVSTWHIRGVLGVYIDIYIYLLGRFTPQSTVLGCLVFTSRATTLLVFPLENTRTFLSLFLSTIDFHSTIVSYLYRPFQFKERPGISRWYWRESPVDRTFRGNRDHS